MYTREHAFRIAEALIRSGEYPHPRPLETPPPPSFTIALSREAGSGGILVAREVGRRLNWPVYDHELLAELAKELKVDVHRLEGVDERRGSWLVECIESFAAASPVTEVTYFRRLIKLLLALGTRGECVIATPAGAQGPRNTGKGHRESPSVSDSAIWKSKRRGKGKAMMEVKEMPKKAEARKVPEAEVAPPAAPVMPWTEPTLAFMRRFSEEMDRLFEDFGLGRRLQSAVGRGRELLRREAGLIPAEWSPRVEILERDGRFIVRAELPGMTKDDIKIEVTDEMLAIQGERKQEKEEKREGYYYGERAYGSFYRSIPLPEGTDPAKATAELHNGVLEVTMPSPKKTEKKSRLLEVQEKK